MNWQRRYREQRWQTWLPSLLATVLVGGLLWWRLLQPLEHLTYQWLFQWRGPRAWDNRIVLVKIDEPSLRQLGKFPWSRDRYTELLNVLQASQPNTVIFDLLFSEYSQADQKFAQAIAQHRTVVLASGWDTPSSRWQPHSILKQAAMATGHILQATDPDGMVRHVPTYVDRTPALSLPSLQTYGLFAQTPLIAANPMQLWPNWLAPVSQLRQYSFIDLLNQQVPPQTLENKIILVGATAAGLNPLITPFDQSPPASGVHLHATLLNNLLQQNLLRPVHGIFWLSLLLLSNVLWGQLLRRLDTIQQLVWSSLIPLGWWCIALAAIHQNWWLPVVLPIALWLTTSVLHWIQQNIYLESKNRRLSYLANVDELTQVANRRAFEQYLQQEWQRSRRQRQPISLILCDVDFFKQFNDFYGHMAGDDCLYQIAQALNNSTKRPTDLIARYGGEEFAVVLGNTNAQGASNLAMRILSQVRATLIPHEASSISHYVTISLGLVTVIPSRGIDWFDMLDAADRALYKAKSTGRDRVCTEVLTASTRTEETTTVK